LVVTPYRREITSMSLPERLFQLQQHGTSVRTELLAGLTTFLTMSYIVFVNPEITWASEEKQVYDEGCLSVPGIFADVTRANQITVRYLDRDGVAQELTTDGVLAVCVQHEMDHLDGKLFIDYLSPLKREMVRKKLAKQRKHVA